MSHISCNRPPPIDGAQKSQPIDLEGERSSGNKITAITQPSERGAKGANEKHAECAAKCVKEKGAKYVFVNDADHKVYAIDAQDKVAAHAGHHVTVKGSVDGENLKLASLEMAK